MDNRVKNSEQQTAFHDHLTLHREYRSNRSGSVPVTTNACNLNESASKKGFVSLVGAGPSDPELLTVKALKAIQQADVLVFDRLVSQDIIALANPDAEHLYVGKRCGFPSLKQPDINELLITKAQQGLYVVRLKGGDPLIFGRGGEEGLALAQHKIPFEFIPGITAALGCAASSFIPLTHRQVSRSVTFITGHVVAGSLPAWSMLANEGQTLVFYMGLEKAIEIETGLLQAGLAATTPVAVVTHGCSPLQQVYIAQLDGLQVLAHTLKGESPALLIIGDVVTLRAELTTTIAAFQPKSEAVINSGHVPVVL
ncbi:uroporphyrinogen-III C-methyltransferase [Photobacterium swingsii]|uniref:uroporphyrinogen-III C-methyltransferase n=1 Tax=Photobacterium swingsii TaxID=680026 RepID=UPI00352C77BB